jgi:hypothetical protein
MPDHLSMVYGGTPHPLPQVTLHRWRADYGQTQLGPSGLQKGELLDLVLALPFGILPPPVDIGHPIGQLLEVHLGRIPGLMHILKLNLQKGNPPSELAGLPVNEGQ